MTSPGGAPRWERDDPYAVEVRDDRLTNRIRTARGHESKAVADAAGPPEAQIANTRALVRRLLQEHADGSTP
jgi:hypothetical protein